MNHQSRCSFVVAQAACAQVEALAMKEANYSARAQGREPPYSYPHFLELQNSYLIGHNAVIDFLEEVE